MKRAGDHLVGEWVVVGGTVLPLLGIDHRTTTDIDVAMLSPSAPNHTLALMGIAEELGLPIESINQAAAYFLYKIDSFQSHLIVLHRGKKSTFYRPDIHLFFQLKLSRFSESDLRDCIVYLEFTKRSKEPFAPENLLKLVKKEKKKTTHTEKANRLEVLIQNLKG